MARGVAKYAAPRIIGRLRRICRKSRDTPANLRNFARLPAQWLCAIYAGFSGSPDVLRKRGLHGAGVGGGPKCATPRIRVRLRRIFRKSRDSMPNLRNPGPRAVDLRHFL